MMTCEGAEDLAVGSLPGGFLRVVHLIDNKEDNDTTQGCARQ